MATIDGFQGVSNCYVFKSWLQEYAQKVGLPTPVYETVKEGPSHEPSFRSTVIVNDVRYDSLPGFFNRKAAEQSAAEVALMELSMTRNVNQSICQPFHVTGLCKFLLQEYAQKMNYAIPLYQCQKDESQGRAPLFSCIVEIGGIKYIGASAKTKKEAELKAARTVLLAVQSSTNESSEKPVLHSHLTVIPCKKRPIESVNNPEVNANTKKAKKAKLESANNPEVNANTEKAKKAKSKKKMREKKRYADKIKNIHTKVESKIHPEVESKGNNLVEKMDNKAVSGLEAYASRVRGVSSGLLNVEAMKNIINRSANYYGYPGNEQYSSFHGYPGNEQYSGIYGYPGNEQYSGFHPSEGIYGNPSMMLYPASCSDVTGFDTCGNKGY